MRRVVALLCGCVVFGVHVAAADMVTLTASKDNTLYESATGALSNGIGISLFAGRTDDDELRRALLAFDVASAIPAGSTIVSVQLALSVTRVGNSTAYPFELRRVSGDWGEGASNAVIAGGGMGAPAAVGDATWLHRFFNTTLWNNAGGDFAGVASAVQAVGAVGTYQWGSTPAMVADVQSWLNAPVTNFGWLLLGDETVTFTAKRFASRENSDVTLVPLLTVSFVPPRPVPAVSRWSLPLLVIVLALIALARPLYSSLRPPSKKGD